MELHKKQGIIYMTIASFAFALMGLFVKRLGKDFDTVEIVLFRNLIGVLFILATYLKSPFSLRGSKPNLLMFRGFIGTISLYAFAYNLTHTSLGEAFTYYQTSSLFIAAFSFWVLKERMSKAAWFGLILGFLGILVIFRPSIHFNWQNNIMGLMNGILSASAYLAVSELKKYYDTRAIVLVFLSWGVLLPLISMILGMFYYTPSLNFLLAQYKTPQIHHIFDIFAVGISALIGQLFATKAFGIEKAGIVSAISYSNVVFSIILGILIGDTFPDGLTFLGMAMIISSGLIISLNKKEV